MWSECRILKRKKILKQSFGFCRIPCTAAYRLISTHSIFITFIFLMNSFGRAVCPTCNKAVYAAEQVIGPGRKVRVL